MNTDQHSERTEARPVCQASPAAPYPLSHEAPAVSDRTHKPEARTEGSERRKTNPLSEPGFSVASAPYRSASRATAGERLDEACPQKQEQAGSEPSSISYPDSKTQTHNGQQKALIKACPSKSVLVGIDEHGHRFAKVLYCGREWCPICGAKDSPLHQRRKGQWIGKAQQLASVGYLVGTIPPEVREKFRSKRALAKAGTQFKRALQHLGFARGMRRWHVFGDKSTKFHPHLNVLIEAGRISKETLKALKRAWGHICGVPEKRVNLHYQFYTKPAEILHRVKYVQRPVFTDWRWDPELAREMIGFRNASTWGTWAGPVLWKCESPEDTCAEVHQVEALEQGLCPFDGAPIRWQGLVLRTDLIWDQWVSMGAGYFYRDGRGG